MDLMCANKTIQEQRRKGTTTEMYINTSNQEEKEQKENVILQLMGPIK